MTRQVVYSQCNSKFLICIAWLGLYFWWCHPPAEMSVIMTVQEWVGDRLSKSARVTDCPRVHGVTDCPSVHGWRTVQECVGDRLSKSAWVTAIFFLGARPKSMCIAIWKWAAAYFCRPVFWPKCQSPMFNFHSDKTYQTLSQSRHCGKSSHCVLCTCEGFIWVNHPQYPTGPECLSRLWWRFAVRKNPLGL